MKETMEIIAHIHTDFPAKFGIPRQSGLVEELKGRIVFEPEYRNPDAFRGLDGYSHIWLLWKFSGTKRHSWSATVKPPRLGGNKRMGVFATRSPFRPNDIGLSSVKLERLEMDPEFGPVLHVAGADLMDGTAIYDIKPYLPYTDSHPDALSGFAGDVLDYELQVDFPNRWLSMIPKEKQEAIIAVLKQDPRPSYQNIPDRIYGVEFSGFDVRFIVQDQRLTVCEVVPDFHRESRKGRRIEE
ncbi:MAG: tRNA (N6-threonylcarbamoyladenosine(37)-N6)-methyltransferase TrmO [Lachnospiraceae bacterium]|nr:tRNA (N6-threonylcarbamoyladenosine(37)-N6)-methyltransferase TrmO [Lachnospiraceae bacterium]